MSDPLLRVEGLEKSFPTGRERVRALRGVSFELSTGSMLAVTGESGAGKSTLLHLLGGMEKPDRGSIIFDGHELTRLPSQQLAVFRNRSVGFVFQFHHLLPEFSALENVMFPLLLRRVEFAEAEKEALSWLQEVGLSQRRDHKPGELSGGEQQRVAIARALVGGPRLLLGDEPTGNLDTRTSDAIHQLLLELHDRHGLTSVLVTHNPVLAGLCDQREELVDGRIRPQ